MLGYVEIGFWMICFEHSHATILHIRWVHYYSLSIYHLYLYCYYRYNSITSDIVVYTSSMDDSGLSFPKHACHLSTWRKPWLLRLYRGWITSLSYEFIISHYRNPLIGIPVKQPVCSWKVIPGALASSNTGVWSFFQAGLDGQPMLLVLCMAYPWTLEQCKKGPPWSFWGFVGDEKLPSYMGISFIKHVT